MKLQNADTFYFIPEEKQIKREKYYSPFTNILDHQLKINKSMVRAKFSKRTPDKD
jgi:hypothetical protein